MKPRVIVFHPGNQVAKFQAAGVYKAGMLQAYITRLYYDEGRFPFSLLKLLPAALHRRIAKQLSGRNWKDLDPAYVRTIQMLPELIYILLNRLQIMKAWRVRYLVSGYPRFAEAVGRIACSEADILLGVGGTSLQAFQIAREQGVVCILDMTHPHVLSELKVIAEEAKFAPPDEHYETLFTTPDEIQQYLDEIPLADGYIAASSFTRSTLIEHGIDPSRIFVAHFGVDTQFCPPITPRTVSDAPLKVIFPGPIGQRKGLRYLLQAVKNLSPRYPIHVYLTGNLGDLPESYADYRPFVTNLGQLPIDRLVTTFQEMDVMCLPSLFESFARSILDAMACGLPVITTHHTIGSDLIDDGVHGYLIPLRDVAAIEKHLIEFYENPQKRLQMGQAAAERAAQFTWDRYYARIGQIIHEVWQRRESDQKPL